VSFYHKVWHRLGLGRVASVVGMSAGPAAMECYRRAMIGEQTFEGRRENLAQANKLSRTYATLLEALNRHRGRRSRTMPPS
jgi:hypothetical protein